MIQKLTRDECFTAYMYLKLIRKTLGEDNEESEYVSTLLKMFDKGILTLARLINEHFEDQNPLFEIKIAKKYLRPGDESVD